MKTEAEKTKVSPCFVYVTFDGRLLVFTGIRKAIQSVPDYSLIEILKERFDVTQDTNQYQKVVELLYLRQDAVNNPAEMIQSHPDPKCLVADILSKAIYGSNVQTKI
mmetsp:Transcript_4094/g.5031  ORF Transcript_4094/g.5031 Transcript_4094/m.5031 type:complete len:107 (-) Transcript_4094:1759-2079(-)